MIDWSTCNAVERDPERVSGAWVFRGTRIPVAALFENLEDGVPVGILSTRDFLAYLVDGLEHLIDDAASRRCAKPWQGMTWQQPMSAAGRD